MNSIEEIAQAAYRKLSQGDAAGAEALLAPALAMHGENASALQLMGIICQQQNKVSDATRYMRLALKAQPGNAQYHNNLGVTLQAQGETDEALACFRRACELDPKLVSARVGLIRLLMQQGEEEAADQAQVLTMIDPAPAAWDLRSTAERFAGRYDAALASADNAIRLAPQVAQWRPSRALALEQLGRHDEALQEWEALARSGMRSPELVTHLARALSHGRRAGEAQALLLDAVRQWPTDATLHSVLARLLWLQGAGKDFVSEIDKALRQNPTASALRAEGAHLLAKAGQIERGEQMIRDGLALAPDDRALVKALSATLAEQGRLDEALAVIEAHFSPGLRGDRASLYLRLGRAREALAELRAIPRRIDGGQQLVALEALAMRLIGDPGYRKLYDYERFVRTYDVAPPFGTTAEFNAALAKSLRPLHADAEHPLDQTLRNGTQTGRDLRHVGDPVVQAFLAALDAPIRDYIAALSPDDALGVRRRKSYRITGAWSVRLRPGGFHINHVHDSGWISSAYYVELPPETSAGQGQGGWIKFGETPWPLTGGEAEKTVQPRVGMLVLFPSYMLHGTIPFSGGEERLTAAFDVVPA